jgi:Protochlamydia outer membrane protein
MFVCRIMLCSIAAVLAVAPCARAAEAVQATRPSIEVDFHAREWFSTGGSQFNFAAPGGSPNVLSELKWKGMKSKVTELSGAAVLRDTAIFRLAGGYGTIRGGTLQDLDFNGNNRTQLLSDTISTADDQFLFYGQGDLGTRLASWQKPGGRRRSRVDALLGFQHWEEKYVARTTIDAISGAVLSSGSRPVITETYRWDSIRMGLDADIEIISGLSVQARGIYIPWSSFHMDDIHHLRTDRAQDPSGRNSATGGQGAQVDATVSYLLFSGLSLEAGYQWWYIRSGSGTHTARFADGTQVDMPLNSATSLRYGYIFGIRYNFAR